MKMIKTYIPIINAVIDKVNITFIPEAVFQFLFVKNIRNLKFYSIKGRGR